MTVCAAMSDAALRAQVRMPAVQGRYHGVRLRARTAQGGRLGHPFSPFPTARTGLCGRT
jgi:hypothetical protein